MFRAVTLCVVAILVWLFVLGSPRRARCRVATARVVDVVRVTSVEARPWVLTALDRCEPDLRHQGVRV